MSIDTLGLREQKKRETRQAISDHATQLFLERGFDRTTIADIAAAARVAKMTVTNYFPRKEDLALDHHEAFVAGLAEAVAGRAPGESALDAVRRAFLGALERRDPVIGFTGWDFARMIADSPTLVARLRDLHDQREEALAAQLATEPPTQATPTTLATVTPAIPATLATPATDTPATPTTPATLATSAAAAAMDDRGRRLAARAVAAQLAAADRLLFRELQSRTLAGDDDDTIAAALAETAQHVFTLLEPAIGEYARR
ncbi:TetR/AcrR family transcriptional regulator [Nonomuraea turcica]|uniref:TetR/AcrR family transcriptional regulator n=1 Tax=Nonomuraea sp. G32 TaxID=3067274 RepID=UPI00273C0297|nr:TetR family transcriptional regulator [Nonomuraea sp. G32]MDP4503553.1 TetR family transcriptional regulator [Nonomuraea sp. G32]